MPAGSPTLGLTYLEFEALLTAARESPTRCGFALAWQCPLAARGYLPRRQEGPAADRIRALTDPAGRPVAVRVLPANSGDPAPFIEIIKMVRDKFGLEKMVMAADRGLITSARIYALHEADDGSSWITVLRAAAIRKLMAGDSPLQMSLSGQQDLAEISHPGYPGERPIACRNLVLASDRARTRSDLLAATDKLLAPIIARVAAGRLTGAGEIGVAAGKVISKYNTGKHFEVTITDTTLTVTCRHAQIDAEAALDGFDVLRTPSPGQPARRRRRGHRRQEMNLKYAGREFRHIKADDLDLRPVYHYVEERVKAHLLIRMLACDLTWHLRRAWAPLTFTTRPRPPAPRGRDPSPRPRRAVPRPWRS